MENQCKIQKLAERPVLAIKAHSAVTDLPALIGQSYGKIIQYLGQLGEQPSGEPYVAYFNIQPDDPEFDVEMGFPVGKPLPAQGDIIAGVIPEMTAVTYLHVGPYQTLEAAYKLVMDWMAENGHEGSGVFYEFYLNDPNQVAPDEVKTAVVIPLK